ncbi:hypothetical protein DFH29DRAFT_261276 [Suillus ampliporus]|nr:hypothetical protein DFH29DRAFT_261276 [Suillus ampliporus]
MLPSHLRQSPLLHHILVTAFLMSLCHLILTGALKTASRLPLGLEYGLPLRPPLPLRSQSATRNWQVSVAKQDLSHTRIRHGHGRCSSFTNRTIANSAITSYLCLYHMARPVTVTYHIHLSSSEASLSAHFLAIEFSACYWIAQGH